MWVYVIENDNSIDFELFDFRQAAYLPWALIATYE